MFKFVEDNEYFNLTVENLDFNQFTDIECSDEFEETELYPCLPSNLSDLFEYEDGEYYIKDEYSDEISNLEHSLSKLWDYLESKGYTFKIVNKVVDFCKKFH